MNKATQHSRWHRIDPQTGQKIIRRFHVDATPPSPWVRGTGPHSEEARAKILHYNRLHFKGQPKSANQKQKMSNTKLGKKFTAQHRANLSASWQSKREMKRLLIIEAFKMAEALGKAHYNTND